MVTRSENRDATSPENSPPLSVVVGRFRDLDDEADWQTMYNQLVRDRDVEGVVALVGALRERGGEVSSSVFGALRYKHFISLCARAHPPALHQAIQFTRLSAIKDNRLYTLLVQLCCSSNNTHHAFLLPGMMREVGLKPDTILYTSMISAFAKEGDTAGAFQAYEAMKQEHVRPNEVTFASLLHAIATELKGLKKATLGEDSFNSRVRYLVSRAEGVVSEEMSSLSVSPDSVVFNTLLDVQRQAKHFHRLIATWEQMEDSGVRPTAASYCTVMSACGDMGKHALGLQYYEEFRLQGQMQGTKELYTCAIHLHKFEGGWEAAWRVFEEQAQAGVETDAQGYAALMDVAARGGDVEQAFSLLAELERREQQPGSRHMLQGPSACQLYATLLGVCARVGLPERAAELYTSMKARGVRPSEDVFNALLDSFGKALQPRRALAVLDDMAQAHIPPSSTTYGALIHAAGQTGDTEMAFEMFQRSRRDGIAPTEAICEMLLLIFLKRIRSHGALATTSPSSSLGSQWVTQALQVYRETITSGVRPGPKTLNKMLACLRVTQKRATQLRRLGEPGSQAPEGPTLLASFGAPSAVGQSGRGGGGPSHFGRPSVSTSHRHFPSGLHFGGAGRGAGGQPFRLSPALALGPENERGFYQSPAVSLYEEAQRMGTVPLFELSRGSRVVDLRRHPRDAACVALLSLLVHVRQITEGGSLRVPSCTIKLKTLSTQPKDKPSKASEYESLNLNQMQSEISRQVLAQREDSVSSSQFHHQTPLEVRGSKRASLSGTAVVNLLKHLRLPYKGGAASGEIRINGKLLYRWLSRSPDGNRICSPTRGNFSNKVGDESGWGKPMWYNGSGEFNDINPFNDLPLSNRS